MTKRPTLLLFGLLFLLASGWFLLNLTRLPMTLVNPLSEAQIAAAVEEVTSNEALPELARPLTDELVEALETQMQPDGETDTPTAPAPETGNNSERLNLTLSAVSLFITAVGFVFTAVFTIRQDRRDADLYRLELEKLRREISQIKQSQTPQTPSNSA